MTQDNQNISLGKKGMNRDSHPSNLTETEYSFAENANYEDESGNSYPMLQNEHSNILCTKFKEGFKVIGNKQDLNEDRTYYFLTNPDTGVSEIGYISNIQNILSVDEIEIDCGCNIVTQLDTPLEEKEQVETCSYNTIINDSCNKCLNFSINNPIREGNIQLKDEKCGKRLYWTDNFNPQRFLDLSNLEQYNFIGQVSCDEVAEETCLDCNKLLMFPSFSKMCITPTAIQYGGRLRAGTYEFLGAYCDKAGNEISQYFSITNPVTIFDENNNILEQTELDYISNFAIKLEVEGLDTQYGYYKIAVIQRADVNGATSYFIEGVHSTSDTTILYSSDQDKERTTLNNLLAPKVVYTRAEGMTSSNGFLFQYGLEAQKEMNLQPVVNLMGGFLRWQTSVAKEDLYNDGVNNSLYKGYMRDEVYPFSIRFITDKGFETAIFPFIGRPANSIDLEQVSNMDTDSISKFVPKCAENSRNQRWQFYNTASLLGVCETENLSFETVNRTIKRSCTINNVGEIVSSSLPLVIRNLQGYSGLANYIVENSDQICNEGNPNRYNEDICNGFKLDNFDAINCDPEFLNTCSEPLLKTQELVIQEVVGETVAAQNKIIPEEYIRTLSPSTCDPYERVFTDNTVDPPSAITDTLDQIVRDNAFASEFMVSEVPTNAGDPRSYSQVFKRSSEYNNFDCLRSVEATRIFDILNNRGDSYDMHYLGAVVLGDLQTQYNSTFTTGTDEGFTSKVHKGARWFKVPKKDVDTQNIENTSNFIFEISPRLDTEFQDELPVGNDLRYNVFPSCDVIDPLYSGSFNVDTGLLLEIDNNSLFEDFVYIAIDSPIKKEQVVTETQTDNSTVPPTTVEVVVEDFETDPQPEKFRLAPPSGCFTAIYRDVEIERLEVTYDRIILGKTQTYQATCEFNVPVVDSCDPVPFEYGSFSYWESTQNYPRNKELYDSSRLNIPTDAIDQTLRDEFVSLYTEGEADGSYVMRSDTDFCGAPIRHFKFPDNEISPFISDSFLPAFQDSVIYPLGVSIDNKVINSFLDVAVVNNLITQEERDSITSYEIFRGDRTIDKSIIGKGLLYDTYKYDEEGRDVYFPNYPYNDLGEDTLNYQDINKTRKTPHPFGGTSNNRFTFHSPELHFNKPALGTEINFEGYQFGNSEGLFSDVEGHSEWVILGSDAFTTATVLAIAEVTFEIAIQASITAADIVGDTFFFGGLTAGTNAAGVAGGLGLLGLSTLFNIADGFGRVGRIRYEWLEIFRNNGKLHQFASFYTSTGKYNRFLANIDTGNKLRGLAATAYLKPSRFNIAEDSTGESISFNNVDRESSVYTSLGEGFNMNYSPEYYTWDNFDLDRSNSSRTTASLAGVCRSGRTPEIQRNIASPYVSMKNFVPDQYNRLEGVKWLSTSFCGNLTKETENCEPIFGGDIFISRFALKRKVPLFLATSIDQAPLTPFTYSNYGNIGTPEFFADFATGSRTESIGDALFPDISTDYNFDCETGARDFYLRPPSRMYLYYYGIPNFLVESEINLNFRYGRRERRDNFFPNESDYEDWTQETNVSIKNDNSYFYNNTYSKNVSRIADRMLPSTFDGELYDCLFDAPNGVIYSVQDSSEQDINDPWLIYRPLDFHQFPTSSGKLIDLKGIESAQVMGRFENQVILFNAIDTLRDRLTAENRELGNGGIFATRPLEFKMTDLGYAGTQHKSIVSCEYGHFWVDAKRGQVFQVDQNGKNLKEITIGLRNWFKEHLPFKILRRNTENLTYEDLDNNFKGIGIAMGWDSRFKRVFITKKDYIVLRPIFTANNIFYGVEERDTFINELALTGFEFDRILEDNTIRFIREVDNVMEEQFRNLTPLLFDNQDFFEDVSFTLAYNPLVESWVSYYSFKPDYYINHHNYFQTGNNFAVDSSENGLWSHLLTNKSYFVFYGKKYSWTIDIPVKENYVNKILSNVEYWMDTRRYHNEYDFAEKRNIGFNKAWVYNHSNNSGQLNLVTELKNNLYQKTQYPKINLNNTKDIIATENDKKWTFNHFFNQVTDELNNTPIWVFDRNQINKEINNKAIRYNQTWQDRLRGDWFNVRLTFDKDSRFKQIFKWANFKEKQYI